MIKRKSIWETIQVWKITSAKYGSGGNGTFSECFEYVQMKYVWEPKSLMLYSCVIVAMEQKPKAKWTSREANKEEEKKRTVIVIEQRQTDNCQL